MKPLLLMSACALAAVHAVPALAQQTQTELPPSATPVPPGDTYVPPSETVDAAVVPAGGEVQTDVLAVTDEAIIITATRRAEELSDVPIAVSAFSGERLENSGVNDVRALNQLAPSLNISGATSESSFVAHIRGVGTVGENPGLESSVGLFIDGVYRSRIGVGLGELGPIERIEVLRGPQGTLFGRNTSAGLINIITEGPEFDLGGQASLEYGNYDHIRAEASLTGPIIDDVLAARIDGVYFERDGFIKDVTAGDRHNNRDRWLVRGQLLYEPNDDLSFRLIGDYSTRDEECCGAVFQEPIRSLRRDDSGNVEVIPNTLLPLLQALGAVIPRAAGNDPFVRAQSVTPGFGYRADGYDWGVSGELDWDLGWANLTSITAYREFLAEQGQDADFTNLDILRRTNLSRGFDTFTQEFRLQGTAFDERLDWLIGAYYANETLTVEDDLKFGADYEKYANCLVVAAVPGLAPSLNPASPTCSSFPASVFPGYQGFAALLGAPRLNETGVVRNFFVQDSRNYAFFTHNVIDVVPDMLSLTLGLRYTNERKELEGSFNTNNDLCTALINSPFFTLQALPCVINDTAPAGFSSGDPGTERNEEEFTGTAVLSWTPDPELLLYASYSRGYKAGGFNLDTSALDRACNPNFDPTCAAKLALPANTVGNARPEASDLHFEPEIVDAYELGVKWDGPGIDINLALFYEAFEQFQLNTFNGVNFEVTNIEACEDDLGGGDEDLSPATGACDPDRTKPGVISKGVELEMFAYPAPYLSVGAGFTYLDSRYEDDLTGTDGRPLAPTLFQLPGNLTFASKYSVTGSLAWQPPLPGSDLSTLFYLDFHFQSDMNTGSDQDIEKVQDAFTTVNGRLGLYGPDKLWGIELWGQNLFNVKYQQVAADAPLLGSGTYEAVARGLIPSANQLYIAFPGEPRTYGITLLTRF